MMNKSAFMVFLFFGAIALHGQTLKPATKGPIKLDLDEAGRVKAISSYGVTKWNRYDVKLTYDAQIITHEKFIKDLGKVFLDAHTTLMEEFNPLVPLYQELWGTEFNKIKDDLKELGSLLIEPNAETILNAKPAGAYPYLGGKDFLYKNLFGDIFTVTINGNSKTNCFKNPIVILAEDIKPVNNELKLTITKANFYKQFIQSFYKKIKGESDTLFKNLSAKAFYQDSIRKRDSLKQEIETFQKKIDKENLYVCEEDLATLKELLTKTHSNFFIRILKSHWMKSWIWYTAGTLPINPLSFTEERLVPMQIGFDNESAQEYDNYRASALEQMKTQTLNEAKINYPVFDSLMRQKGTGKTIFSYSEANEQRKKANKEKAGSGQKIFVTTTSLVLEIVDAEDKVMYRSFDAAKKLAGSGPEDMPTVSTKTKVKLVAYNMKNEENVTKKENPVDIPDHSKAIAEINQVADMAILLAGNVAGLPVAVTGFLNQLRDPQKKPSPSTISPFTRTEPIENSEEGMIPETSLPRGVTLLESTGNPTILKDSRTGAIYNLADSIRQRLVRQKITCRYFSDVVVAYVDSAMNPISRRVRIDTIKRYLDQVLNELGPYIQQGIRIAYLKFADRETKSVLNKLDLQLALLELSTSPEAYALPPAELKADTDTAPQFRNRIDSFATETKAKEKNTEISLLNKKGETIALVKDSYKTAPTHWILPSIGIGYLAHSFRRSDATITNGVITNTVDEERVRLIAGVHIYPRPVIMADDRFITGLAKEELLSRFSFFLGLSFPKPLYNIHGGLSVDIWAGVKLTGGVHLYRYTAHKLLNNTISDQESNYQYNGAFASLQLDPSSLVKLLGIIK